MRKPSLADTVHRLSGKAPPLNFHLERPYGWTHGSDGIRLQSRPGKGERRKQGFESPPFSDHGMWNSSLGSVEGCIAPWLSTVSFDKGERKERMDYKKVAAYASAQTRSAIESAAQIKENFKNLMVNVEVYGDSLSVETNIDFMSPEETEE